MVGAGMRVRTDGMGNIFGRWEGSSPEEGAPASAPCRVCAPTSGAGALGLHFTWRCWGGSSDTPVLSSQFLDAGGHVCTADTSLRTELLVS